METNELTIDELIDDLTIDPAMEQAWHEMYLKYREAALKYRAEHPVILYYVHRWSNGQLSAYPREGPEYEFITGALWPGSIYYDPSQDTAGPLKPAFLYVKAATYEEAIYKAARRPQNDWKIKPPSARQAFAEYVFGDKLKDIEMIGV